MSLKLGEAHAAAAEYAYLAQVRQALIAADVCLITIMIDGYGWPFRWRPMAVWMLRMANRQY